ncbi:MAG TPA: T9SS type A sorting domain-containing protein [Flavobacteriaceae bacterium]|nr:T9SS type A sorting domain-containing protein [Flavobacteriaceae bacterium]
MKKIKLTLLATMIGCFSYSQTYISGGLYADNTWSPSGNPFIVSGNFVVFEEITLTIDPGVIIKFESGAGLELRGKLIAIGNETNNITFTSNSISPVPGSWNGIKVIGTTSPLGIGNQVTMEYCKGEFAQYFIDLTIAYHGPYIFRHCIFSNNFQTNKDGGLPYTLFDNCLFESNNVALGSTQFDSTVSNSSFINNINGVERINIVDSCFFSGNTGIALSPGGTTINCTIENNNIGVSSYFNSTNNIFINNTIRNNSIGVEIGSYFNGSINFTGNIICSNSAYNIKFLSTNNADLSNNCWCSADSAYIRSTIYDGYTDTSYGLVDFLPFTTGCSLGINEPAENNNSLATIFPNPFNETIEIIGGKNELIEVTIFDLLGRKILFNKFTNSNKINTETLSKGIYFYQIENDKGSFQKGKLIKK